MTFYQLVIIGFISAIFACGLLYFKEKHRRGRQDRALAKLISMNKPYPGSREELKKRFGDVSDGKLKEIAECLVEGGADKVYQSISDSSDRARKIVDRALLKNGGER